METAAWLILIFPLLGCLVISLGYKLWPGKVPGVIGTLAIAAAFVCAIIAVVDLQGAARRSGRSSPWPGTTRSPRASTRSSRS